MKTYHYRVVCERHGDIEPVGHESPYDLGYCPHCQEEHPGEMYPNQLMVFPVKNEGTGDGTETRR